MLTLPAGETNRGNRAAAMQRRSEWQSGECKGKFGLGPRADCLVHKQNGTIVAGDRLTLSGVALVSMMKSSNLRNYYNAPAFRLLHGSRLWSVLGQR
jgi:hypothetical protein